MPCASLHVSIAHAATFHVDDHDGDAYSTKSLRGGLIRVARSRRRNGHCPGRLLGHRLGAGRGPRDAEQQASDSGEQCW
jgi:hypothetical protein